jgi:hypothetical protein
MMKVVILLSTTLLLAMSSVAQYSGTQRTPSDSLVGERMINTIEQSLNL